jgi:hypothetical protein
MRVRLTRRLANSIDGVNLSDRSVGDVFDVTRHDAELLIAEEWAVPVARGPTARPFRTVGRLPRVGARRPLRLAAQLRNIRRQIEQRFFPPHRRRRAEDLIREKWHDEHAKVLNGR